jgi:hypothetical protein
MNKRQREERSTFYQKPIWVDQRGDRESDACELTRFASGRKPVLQPVACIGATG